MSDIFIGHATEDRPRVKPLVDTLERQGWSVWWDRTILPGKTWDRVLEAALQDARCVIVLWSQDSVESDWVRAEAEEAKQRGILVPVLLDDVSIPLAFNRIQGARLVGWSGTLPNAEFDALVRAVSGVVSNTAPAEPESKTRFNKDPSAFAADAARRRSRVMPQAGFPDPVSGKPIVGAIPLIVCGFLAIIAAARPLTASRLAVVIGWLVLFSGGFQLIYAFNSKGVGHINWKLPVAILYLTVGSILFCIPSWDLTHSLTHWRFSFWSREGWTWWLTSRAAAPPGQAGSCATASAP